MRADRGEKAAWPDCAAGRGLFVGPLHGRQLFGQSEAVECELAVEKWFFGMLGVEWSGMKDVESEFGVEKWFFELFGVEWIL